MAIGAAAVGRVDRVGIAVEYAGAAVDLVGIRGIRRGELGGHREPARAQHALEAAGRYVAGQDRQRIAGNRFVLEFHALLSGLLAHDAQPRRASLQALVDRGLYVPHGFDAARDALTALVREHPHALHGRDHFAMAVRAHAAAGAVAQLLRAIHRAGHAGRAQHALPAHPAVEQKPLHRALDGSDRPLQPPVADGAPERCETDERGLEPAIDAIESARMTHRPLPHAVHHRPVSATPFARIRRSRSSSV